MVPSPAPVPPMPLTDATDADGKRSAGRLRMIVENAAYANVATAKQLTITTKESVHTVGMRHIIPAVPRTAMTFRAAPTLHPRADQVARHAAAEEVPDVGGEERHPETHQALFELEALGDEIDREPVGDEEPHGIGEALGEDVAPGLTQAEERSVGQRLLRPALVCVPAPVGVASDVVALFGARASGDLPDAGRTRGTTMSHRNPSMPVSRNAGPPAPERVVDGQHDPRRERAADRRSAVEKGDGPSRFTPRKPFGDGLGRARPVAGFAEPQRKPERGEAPQPGRQRRRHRGDGIPQHREAEARPAFPADRLCRPAIVCPIA